MINDMREAMAKELDHLVYQWFQESTVAHHIEENGGHLAKRSRFVAEKAAEWGAQWQSQQAQGEATAEVDAICKHCNQEYSVPLFRAGNATRAMLCNFCECPHCGERNDLWICVRPGLSAPPAPAAVPEGCMDKAREEIEDFIQGAYDLHSIAVCDEDVSPDEQSKFQCISQSDLLSELETFSFSADVLSSAPAAVPERIKARDASHFISEPSWLEAERFAQGFNCCINKLAAAPQPATSAVPEPATEPEGWSQWADRITDELHDLFLNAPRDECPGWGAINEIVTGDAPELSDTEELAAAKDKAEDLAILLDLIRKALGVPEEPHQTLQERILEAGMALYNVGLQHDISQLEDVQALYASKKQAEASAMEKSADLVEFHGDDWAGSVRMLRAEAQLRRTQAGAEDE